MLVLGAFAAQTWLVETGGKYDLDQIFNGSLGGGNSGVEFHENRWKGTSRTHTNERSVTTIQCNALTNKHNSSL